MELTMFDTMLQLPLFQGLTIQEFTDAMSCVRLDFVNYERGDEIAIQNEPCKKVICVINGDLQSEYSHSQSLFKITETLPKIGIIEPYNLYGMTQRYSRSYSFMTDGNILSINKESFVRHLLDKDIIKINMMNICCNRYHKTLNLLCNTPDNNVSQKIIKFLLSYSSVDKGEKTVSIYMNDFANLLHETRLNVSKALNDMHDKGLIVIKRGGFYIPDFKKLVSEYK